MAGLSVPRWLVAVALTTLTWLVAREAVGKSASMHQRNKRARFRFVHIPKTGGLAFRTELSRPGSCSAIDFNSARREHADLESNVIAAGKRPILVLREPLARLHSAFQFWKHGTKLLRMHRSPQSKGLFNVVRRMRFDDFLEGILNSSSPWSAQATMITDAPQSVGGWAWKEHFEPQSHWMNQESPHTTVVCYSDENLASRFSCMAAGLGINCNFSTMAVVNPTDRRTHTPTLEPALMTKIRDHLKSDYTLYEKYCGLCTNSCLCCHSVGGAAACGLGENSLRSTGK
eukprot:6212702-Pleurochrysis_carterae.AAC.1